MKPIQYIIQFAIVFFGAWAASAQTWNPTAASTANWHAIASSADGTKLVAAVEQGGIYTSANSGQSWNQAPFAPTAA